MERRSATNLGRACGKVILLGEHAVVYGIPALAVGIEQAVIDAINARKTPSLADARERTCLAVAKEILANKGLSDDSYAAAEKTVGLESLVALVATVGSFSMTCLTAATFQIDPPPNNPTPLAE